MADWKTEIARCYNLPITVKLQLHIFGDTSEKAYGAVAYLRTPVDPIEVSFVMAKGPSFCARETGDTPKIGTKGCSSCYSAIQINHTRN